MLWSILPAWLNFSTSPISFWNNNKSKYYLLLGISTMILLVAYTKKSFLQVSLNKSSILSSLTGALNGLVEWGVVKCDPPPTCGIHVFQTPLSLSEIFLLGKPAWILESDGWIQTFMTLGRKLLDSTVRLTPITTWNDRFCHRSHMWNHVVTFKCFPYLL